MSLLVGTKLYGYCGGYFGRDFGLDHCGSSCRVEAAGTDWVVARGEHGQLGFASGEGIHDDLQPYTVPEEPEEDLP